MKLYTRVVFIGDPAKLRDPVPKGTGGEYRGKKAGTEWHWVFFDGTENAQTVTLDELDKVPDDQQDKARMLAHVLAVKCDVDRLTDEERKMLFAYYCEK